MQIYGKSGRRKDPAKREGMGDGGKFPSGLEI